MRSAKPRGRRLATPAKKAIAPKPVSKAGIAAISKAMSKPRTSRPHSK